MDDKLDNIKAMKILNLILNGNGGKEEAVTFINQDGKKVTFDVSGNGIKTPADMKGYREAIDEVLSHGLVTDKVDKSVSSLTDWLKLPEDTNGGKEQFTKRLNDAQSAVKSATPLPPMDLEKEAKSIGPHKAAVILEKALGKVDGKNWSYDPHGFGDTPVMFVDVGKLSDRGLESEQDKAVAKLVADLKAAGITSPTSKVGYNEEKGRLQINLDRLNETDLKVLAKLQREQNRDGVTIGGEGIGAGTRAIKKEEAAPESDKSRAKPADAFPNSPEPGLDQDAVDNLEVTGADPIRKQMTASTREAPDNLEVAADDPIRKQMPKGTDKTPVNPWRDIDSTPEKGAPAPVRINEAVDNLEVAADDPIRKQMPTSTSKAPEDARTQPEASRIVQESGKANGPAKAGCVAEVVGFGETDNGLAVTIIRKGGKLYAKADDEHDPSKMLTRDDRHYGDRIITATITPNRGEPSQRVTNQFKVAEAGHLEVKAPSTPVAQPGQAPTAGR